MYIEIHNHEKFNQKVLYFKLNNALNMDLETETNHKIAGIYAIYKDMTCLYVGQSKNIASRIATHLKGKYENSTEVFIWDIEDIGFSDFNSRSKESKDEILLNSEKYLMTRLKPIENLDIDFSFTLEEDKKPNICLESDSSFTLLNNKYNIVITDSYSEGLDDLTIEIDRLDFNNEVDRDSYKKIRNIILEHDSFGFSTKGLENE